MCSDSELVTRNPKMTLRERWQKKPFGKAMGTVAEEAQRKSDAERWQKKPSGKTAGNGG